MPQNDQVDSNTAKATVDFWWRTEFAFYLLGGMQMRSMIFFFLGGLVSFFLFQNFDRVELPLPKTRVVPVVHPTVAAAIEDLFREEAREQNILEKEIGGF